MSFFDGCNPIDCALAAVEEMGLSIGPVKIIKRVWSGKKLGEGNVTDTVVQISPTPRIQQIKENHRNKEGGLEKRADVLLKMISKSKYPTKDELELISENKNTELYYMINEDLYELVEVIEKIAYWNILIKRSKKRRLNL